MELHRERARVDPAAFNSYVLRDEETGSPIALQPMHVEWHRLISAHKRTLIWSHVEAGKSQQISIGRALFELGRNSNLRIVIASNTDGQAQKICGAIAKYIEQSKELHEVFPNLKRARGAVWTKHQLQIERDKEDPSVAKDPSVATCGVHGNILGSRIDFLIVDDILDYENVRSANQRHELRAWFRSTLEGRLTRSYKIVCVGTAWDKDDIMHHFASEEDWVAVRYPVVDEAGTLSWPERWPAERIAEKARTLGVVEANRQLRCVARSDEEARFKRAWIDTCLQRGNGKSMVYALESVPPGYRVFTGVDLSVGNAHSDLTALFTIAIHPDESRQVLCVESGRWGGPEIVRRIKDAHRRFDSIVIVENNASQEFILQFTRESSAVPVRPFTTTKNAFKNPEFGIESLATEMENGKWIIPNVNGSMHPEIAAWINDLLYYDPESHPGDRLMASYFAREGARETKRKKIVRRQVDTLRR
jgi:hypothetical protein